jgi:hypothetical protein
MKSMLILLPILGLLNTAGPGNNKGFTNQNIDEIKYRYHDSSVPPQFHRSYTITVTATTVAIIVDSYGKIITDKKFDGSPEQFNNLLKLLDAGKVKNTKVKKEKGCTGGTSEDITCYKAGQSVFTGYAAYCGGQTTGDLGGKLDDFRTAIIALIPEWDKVMNRE